MAPGAHFCRLRSISRILCRQIPYLKSNFHNELGSNYNRFAVLSIRQLCSSVASDSQSKSEPAIQTSSKPLEMTFEEYQKLKRKIRSMQRIAGIPVAALALMTSSAVSAYLNPNMFDAPPDQIQPILGMDPLMFCGLCGVASAGVGFVAGSAVFRSLWKIFNKDIAMKMDMREADFLERISSKRAASFSKFEDDYYGESIKTLSDYRQWLREQQKKKKVDEKFAKTEKEEKKGAAEVN